LQNIDQVQTPNVLKNDVVYYTSSRDHKRYIGSPFVYKSAPPSPTTQVSWSTNHPEIVKGLVIELPLASEKFFYLS
jgi:hypothetical protein